ncbi:MAG: thioredoxin-disulfide reductase [Treponema sp.]|nr:thioredoxin-disulfide reductase [Treponema sp.]
MDTEKYDYIIIGAGVAGLASAQYAARGGLNTLVLDLAGSGGQVMQITELDNYPGVFPTVDGPSFIQKMEEQTKAFGAKIEMVQVTAIDKKDDKFFVTSRKKVYEAPYLCLATGAIHKTLGVSGEAELTGRGVSYCATCDGPFFRNRKIVVVGGGDTACAEATYLSTITSDLHIIHRRDKFRAQKAVVDKMLSKGVEPIYDTVVKSINGNGKVESVTLENVKTKEESTLAADAVFIFTGIQAQTDLVDMLAKDQGGYIKTDENMETSMPGLFAAGDVRSKPFRQVVTAVSDGAIAAHIVCQRLL